MMFLPYAALMREKEDYAGCLETTGRDPFYCVYPAADGRFLAVGAVESLSRSLLLRLTGREDLAAASCDQARWEDVRGELRRTFQKKTMKEWADIFEGQEACVSPVLTIREALVNPQLIARGRARRRRPGPALPGHPFSFSRSRPRRGLYPERIGQHTLSVLRALGLSARQIQDLRRRRVIV